MNRRNVLGGSVAAGAASLMGFLSAPAPIYATATLESMTPQVGCLWGDIDADGNFTAWDTEWERDDLYVIGLLFEFADGYRTAYNPIADPVTYAEWEPAFHVNQIEDAHPDDLVTAVQVILVV